MADEEDDDEPSFASASGSSPPQDPARVAHLEGVEAWLEATFKAVPIPSHRKNHRRISVLKSEIFGDYLVWSTGPEPAKLFRPRLSVGELEATVKGVFPLVQEGTIGTDPEIFFYGLARVDQGPQSAGFFRAPVPSPPVVPHGEEGAAGPSSLGTARAPTAPALQRAAAP